MGKQESDERKPKPEGTFRATPDDKDDTEDDTEGHGWRAPSPRSRGE